MSTKETEPILLTKETVMRLLKDVKELVKSPLISNGIYYQHDDTDMLKGKAMIIGPKDTPYEYGYYLFEFAYPANYPHSPPVVKFCTGDGMTRFNPNLYKNGKVCLSVLNTWNGDQWTGCQTISSILLALCTLLNDAPLLNEPGITTTHPDFANYTKIIEYKNIEIAILKMINKVPGVYPEKFDFFYSIVRENFFKNKDTVLKCLEDKARENLKTEQIVTGIYSMNVSINYPNLLNSFKELTESTK